MYAVITRRYRQAGAEIRIPVYESRAGGMESWQPSLLRSPRTAGHFQGYRKCTIRLPVYGKWGAPSAFLPDRECETPVTRGA